jgi:hypothetical protein
MTSFNVGSNKYSLHLQIVVIVDFFIYICVGTRIEVPAQNYRNWTIRFQKLDPPILSIPTVVRGSVGIDEEALSPTN